MSSNTSFIWQRAPQGTAFVLAQALAHWQQNPASSMGCSEKEDIIASAAHAFLHEAASREENRARTFGQGLAELAKASGSGICSGVSAVLAGPVVGYRKHGRHGILGGTAEGLSQGISVVSSSLEAGATKLAEGYTTRRSTLPSRGNVDFQDEGAGMSPGLYESQCTVDRDMMQEMSKIYYRERRRIYEGLDRSPTYTLEGRRLDSSDTITSDHDHSDLYDTLGVRINAQSRDIRKAYIARAQTNHPDKNPNDPLAHERFIAVTQAYKILISKQRREKDLEEKNINCQDSTLSATRARTTSHVRPSKAIGDLDFGTVIEIVFGNSNLEHLTGDLTKALTFAAQHGLLKTPYDGPSNPRKQSKSHNQRASTPFKSDRNKLSDDDDSFEFVGASRGKFQAERITWLAEVLVQRIEPWLAGDQQGVLMHAHHETLVGKGELFGGEILRTVGKAYASAAQKSISMSRSTIRSALFSFDEKAERICLRAEMAATQEQGCLNPGHGPGDKTESSEGRRSTAQGDQLKMDESARKLGRVWIAAKWDIQKTLREVVRRVLTDETVSREVLVARSEAIIGIASVFERA